MRRVGIDRRDGRGCPRRGRARRSRRPERTREPRPGGPGGAGATGPADGAPPRRARREQERLAALVIRHDSGIGAPPGGPAPGGPAEPPHACTASCVRRCLEGAAAAARGPLSGGSPLRRVRLVGGADVSFDKATAAPAQRAVAGLVVLSFPALEVVWEGGSESDLRVPYLPGYLGFREVAPLRALVDGARAAGFAPDVVLVDGLGTWHPRRCGSASHLGVTAGVPTVGLAKKMLPEGGATKGGVRAAVDGLREAGGAPGAGGVAVVPVVAGSGEVLGAAVAGHGGGATNPVYVSVGHAVGLATATELVLRCCRNRVPEPIRQADIRTRAWGRERWGAPG